MKPYHSVGTERCLLNCCWQTAKVISDLFQVDRQKVLFLTHFWCRSQVDAGNKYSRCHCAFCVVPQSLVQSTVKELGRCCSVPGDLIFVDVQKKVL